MRFRFAFAIATLCTGIIAACASGDLESQDGGIGGDLNPDVDGSVDAATDATGISSIDAAGRHDSSAAPDTSLPGQPDSGTGLDSGAPTDSGGSTGLDATSDAAADAPTDAAADAPADTSVDAAPDTGGPDCGAPGGSYAASCPTCSLAGTTLTCACKDDAQDADITTLNICGCAQPPVITNNNGVLSCPAP